MSLRRRRSACLRSPLLFLAFLLPGGLRAQEPPRATTPVATLADLRFIAGRWVGELERGRTEEHWSEPAGDNMMGVFRYVKDGKAVFYEILLIEQTDAGPVLRLKHFSPGLVGWEEKAQVYSYPLVAFEPGRAVFEGPDGQTRMTFQRMSADVLSVLLEQMEGGKLVPQEFRYTLMR